MDCDESSYLVLSSKNVIVSYIYFIPGPYGGLVNF